MVYEALGCKKCAHVWRLGRHSAAKHPISNGTVILVQKDGVVGAFIPTVQRLEPEEVEYKWFYRTDGKGTFRKRDTGLFQTGLHSGTKIKFGPFNLQWSINQVGKGWIYYSRLAGEMSSVSDVRICITNETDIESIDATDKKWTYKASPTDPGMRR